jgi:hypothetical protein
MLNHRRRSADCHPGWCSASASTSSLKYAERNPRFEAPILSGRPRWTWCRRIPDYDLPPEIFCQELDQMLTAGFRIHVLGRLEAAVPLGQSLRQLSLQHIYQTAELTTRDGSLDKPPRQRYDARVLGCTPSCKPFDAGRQSDLVGLRVEAHASGRSSHHRPNRAAAFEMVVIAADPPFAAEYPQPRSTVDFR